MIQTSKNQMGKKHYINMIKKEKELNLNLKIVNNNYDFKGKLLKNNYFDKKNPKIINKNKDKNEIDSYNIKSIRNSGFSKDKSLHIKQNDLELKLENDKNIHNNYINLLDFFNFKISDNNLKSKTFYSFSRNYKINKKLNENQVNDKIKEKQENNLSEIDYSPNSFQNYFPNHYNRAIENYKNNIFLNTNNIKNKKSNNTTYFEELSKKSISIDKGNQNMQYYLSPIKDQINRKKVFSLKKQSNKIYLNKETSFSTNFNSNPNRKRDLFIDNKIIGNLFTNNKKMFRKTQNMHLNNLNLLYSENDTQFNQKYINYRNKKSLKGLGLIHISSSPAIIKKNLNSKINLVKEKLSFVKSIVDFAYPEIIIRRSMKQSNDYIKKFKRNIPPYKVELMKNQVKEKILNRYYSSILKIVKSPKKSNLKL